MQRWPWQKILLGTATFLLVLGAAPFGYLSWFGFSHNLAPLSFALPLQRGEYTSPSFKTDLNEGYQIYIYFVPYHRTPLQLNWKIVDDTGAMLKHGSYREDTQPLYGNNVILDRQYRTRRGLRQKIIVTILQDVIPASPIPSLHIGLPEETLGMAYGTGAAVLWAAVIGGLGVILLLAWTFQRWRLRKTHA